MLHITTSETCHSAFGGCITMQNLRFHIRENTWQCQPSMFSDATKGKAVPSVPSTLDLGVHPQFLEQKPIQKDWNSGPDSFVIPKDICV